MFSSPSATECLLFSCQAESILRFCMTGAQDQDGAMYCWGLGLFHGSIIDTVTLSEIDDITFEAELKALFPQPAL
jgi:hypothetical protein